MRQPYLIQRGKFEDTAGKKGIDSILNFDYMGSSEFEWGALPKSLKEIRSRISEYTYLDIPIGNKVITVFCLSEQKSEMKQILEKLAEHKIHLKEFSAFDSYIKDDGYFKDRFDFWWDIENNFMFWKKDPAFETKFKVQIEPK